jgi:hypothetical protein
VPGHAPVLLLNIGKETPIRRILSRWRVAR